MSRSLEVLRRGGPVALRRPLRSGEDFGTLVVRVGPRGEGVAAAFLRGADRCSAAVFVVPKVEPPDLLFELFEGSLGRLRALTIDERVRP